MLTRYREPGSPAISGGWPRCGGISSPSTRPARSRSGCWSWCYEQVRPPYRVSNGQRDKRRRAADTLVKGLADQEFWDGEGTVRLLSWLHVAVVGGFLAIMLGVTARALAGGSPQAAVLGWTGIALGAATIALAVAYVCLDALDTPSMDTPGAKPALGTLAE